MLEAPHYSSAGARRDAAFALPGDVFDGTVNEPVLHQAVKVFLNNQRQGTAATKTRSFVSGGNQKPWKQKGTGRARQGSTRAPHWRGGGTVFGPHPRDYRTEIPRKVKQLARKSALNARAREGALHVVERFAFRKPRTAQLAALLASLGPRGTEGPGAHRGHQHQRLPERPEPADGRGAAVRRGVGLRHPLVGRGGGGRGCAHRRRAGAAAGRARGRGDAQGAQGKRAAAPKPPKAAKPAKAKPAKKSAAKPAAKAKAAKKTTAKKAAGKPAKKAAPKPKKKKGGR